MSNTATLHTTLGDIVIELFPNHAPKTVENFVGLATGAKEWTDPRTGKKSNENLYDGTIFHRVISGFMLQGGDPLGQGFGGPGYQFADEFHGELQFDRPYILAITSAGTVMRTPAAEVRQTGRDSMGVRLVNLDEGATLLSVTRNSEDEISPQK